MSLIEIVEQEELSWQQRWSHIITIGVAILALLYGLNLRSSILGATRIYTNVEAGIEARYPQNWLLDEDGDYVFRVRDMTRAGFKTTLQIQTRPIGRQGTARNVFDTLNINRPQTLSTYNVLSIEDTILPDESEGVRMTYSFVDTDPNPFLQTVPSVVIGEDLLTIRGGQAIIITFLADVRTYEDDQSFFNQFLANLQFN